MKFEHRSQPLIPRRRFILRLARTAGLAAGIILSALGIGVAGYHFIEGLSLLDSFLEASMILSGMGPVHELRTSGGKVFAATYALFSGVAFLTVTALLFAPVIHRILHAFHMTSTFEDPGEYETKSPQGTRRRKA